MISTRELYQIALKQGYDLSSEETVQCLREGIMKRISFFSDTAPSEVESLEAYLHQGELLCVSENQTYPGFISYEFVSGI